MIVLVHVCLHLLTTACITTLWGGRLTCESMEPPSLIEKMQGDWKMVGAEEKGKKIGDPAVENVTMIIKNNQLTYSKTGRVRFTATISLNDKARPVEMNLQMSKGSTNHGIVGLSGDKLLMCISHRFKANDPGQRPTSFTTKMNANNPKSSNLILLEFKRVK